MSKKYVGVVMAIAVTLPILKWLGEQPFMHTPIIAFFLLISSVYQLAGILLALYLVYLAIRIYLPQLIDRKKAK